MLYAKHLYNQIYSSLVYHLELCLDLRMIENYLEFDVTFDFSVILLFDCIEEHGHYKSRNLNSSAYKITSYYKSVMGINGKDANSNLRYT